jgi:tetratricopeptide (TPR) repeat protein
MKKNVVLLFLVSVVILAAAERIPDLEKKLRTVSSSKEKIDVLHQLAWAYKNNTPRLTIKYAAEALTLSRQEQDNEKEAKSLHYIGIGNANLGNYEKALEYYYQAIDMHKRIGDSRGIGLLTISIGNIFWYHSDFEESLEYYNRALKLFAELNDKKAISVILNNRAGVYIQWRKLDKALEDYLQSLKIKEELNSQASIAVTLDNIGIIHRELGSYDKALEAHERALRIFENLESKIGIAKSLNNLGLVYKDRQEYLRALEYYHQSLEIKNETGNKNGIAITLDNVGEIYILTKNFQKALEYQKEALKIREEIGEKFGIANCLSKIGRIYKEMEQFPPALDYLNKSLQLARQSDMKVILKENYLYISEIFYARGDSDKSLQYYKKYTDTKEEIFNRATLNKIREIQMKYETDKWQKRIRKTRQKALNIFLGVVSLLVLTLALLAYNRYRLKNNARQLLEQNKQEIESHKSKLKILNEYLKEFLLLKNRKKYEKSTLTPKQAEIYQQELLTFIEEKKPYLDCELTVNVLAEQLAISTRHLSQVINEQIDKNFCDFINHYRVEEAKKILMQTKENKEISILNIAFDVGFNSKSSFNTVFKKHTGMTPSQFRKKVR